MSKDLTYYRGLPYTLDVERFTEEEDGKLYYRAFYHELPKQVQGIHQDRLWAIKLAKELFDAFVEAQLEWGEEIPEPSVPRFRKRGGAFMFKKSEPASSGTDDTQAGYQSDGGVRDETTASGTGSRLALGMKGR